MKKVQLMSVAAVVLGLNAGQLFADGFICEDSENSLKIKVYNETSPDLGTRNSAVMVISDPRVSTGRKTIASFRADDTLTNSGSTYHVELDERFSALGKRGEYFGGTRLGEIESIELNVSFSYAAPVEKGELLDGYMNITKKNGTTLEHELSCTRYLKGE